MQAAPVNPDPVDPTWLPPPIPNPNQVRDIKEPPPRKLPDEQPHPNLMRIPIRQSKICLRNRVQLSKETTMETDRQKILQALGEKPMKVFEIMKRTNIKIKKTTIGAIEDARRRRSKI